MLAKGYYLDRWLSIFLASPTVLSACALFRGFLLVPLLSQRGLLSGVFFFERLVHRTSKSSHVSDPLFVVIESVNYSQEKNGGFLSYSPIWSFDLFSVCGRFPDCSVYFLNHESASDFYPFASEPWPWNWIFVSRRHFWPDFCATVPKLYPLLLF